MGDGLDLQGLRPPVRAEAVLPRRARRRPRGEVPRSDPADQARFATPKGHVPARTLSSASLAAVSGGEPSISFRTTRLSAAVAF